MIEIEKLEIIKLKKCIKADDHRCVAINILLQLIKQLNNDCLHIKDAQNYINSIDNAIRDYFVAKAEKDNAIIKYFDALDKESK